VSKIAHAKCEALPCYQIRPLTNGPRPNPSLFAILRQTLLQLNCPPCSKADIGQTIQGINCLSGSQRPISYANLLDQDSNFPDQCCVAVIGPRSRKPYGCRQAGWDPLPALSGLGRADATTAVTWAAYFLRSPQSKNGGAFDFRPHPTVPRHKANGLRRVSYGCRLHGHPQAAI